MNNEIKEILDRLERIDHKEYSCGFEFADSGSFDEDCRCFEERKKMANYITNLQQENKKLNGAIQTYDILLKANAEENKQLKDKLSKIETLIINHNCDTGDIYYKYNSKFLKSELKQRILEIVYEQGSDSNE